MSWKNFSNIPVMREPTESSALQIKKLMSIIEKKYNTVFPDFPAFRKWSVDHLEEFYAELWDFVGVVFSKNYETVIDLSVPMSDLPKWFEGAKLNYAENLLKYRDNGIALIIAGEDRQPEHITFAELFEQTKLYAAAFKKHGVIKGDRVACLMSNRKEPVFAMLAATSIGAIWTGALPLLGSQAVLSRLQLVNPKILLTIDSFTNSRANIEMLQKVKEVVDGLPTLEKVIVVPSTNDSKLKDISKIRNSCFLDEFLETGMNADGSIPPLEFEQVSFSHPVFINFTSGTTGVPKAVVHGAGVLFPTCKDFWLNFDCVRGDIWFSMSSVGWVSWNFIITLLFSGITIFLFEGDPYYLSPTYFWDLVEDNKLSHLFLPANVLDDLEKLGYVPTERHKLTALKGGTSGGSVVKHSTYDFLYRIKKDIIFSATYGATELIGTVISLASNMRVYRGELPVASLGVDLQCVDESGNPIEGEMGELIIAQTCPNLLLGLWGDKDGSLCKTTYFGRFSGKFAIGDFAVVNPITKGYIVCGRSDDTIKQRGTRFGCAEVYNIVDSIPEILDSLCITQYSQDLDCRAVLFLKLKKGYLLNRELLNKVQQAIATELTPAHVPEVILETGDIPINMNGKKMEIIIKRIIEKRPYDAASVRNPECLKNFHDLPQLQGF